MIQLIDKSEIRIKRMNEDKYRKAEKERITKLRIFGRNKRIKKLNRPYYTHEKMAFPYLQSIGYDISDIKINRSISGKPDITTCDGKEWEVKVLNSDIVFSRKQLDNFNDNVQILIYDRNKLLEVISFGDLKNGLSIYRIRELKISKCRIIYLRKSGYIIGICHQEFVYNENQKLIDVKTSYLRA